VPARLTVAYAGEPGAFAEDALIEAFGNDAGREGVGGFREVFEAVASGAAARGVVPIENVLNGSVREVYDLLLEFELVIVGEVVVPVRLCLAALPGQQIDSIERVYSHVQALGQAEAFLRTRAWTLLTTYNTAGAGRLVAESGERGVAAVLSPRAARIFGLEILVDDVQGSEDNRTRFLVLAAAAAAPGPGVEDGSRAGHSRSKGSVPPMRTTLAFAVRNEPGTLLAALRAFAKRGVNLSKLESRPSRVAAWEYVFWTDADGDGADPACLAALADLASVSTMVRVFGSYPRAASD
jgi:prephenate dehydratase